MWYDSAADAEQTQTKVFIGPPRHYLRDAVITAGLPPDMSASAVLAQDFHDYDGVMVLDNASAFLQGRGAVFIDTINGGDWFTYEAVDGDTLLFVRRLSGTTQAFSADNIVSQWRDITDYVADVRPRGTLRNAQGRWTCSLSGDQWNSLVQFDMATVLVLQRVRNSTYFNLAADVVDPGWSDWFTRFRGTLGPVAAKADDRHGADWSVTAYGMAGILEQMQNTPGYYGSELIDGVRTATSSITDPSQVPWLGDGVTPLTPDAANDQRKGTGWASAGIPSLGEPLFARPVGNVQNSPPLPDYVRGYGIKIQQVAPEGFSSDGATAQEMCAFEIVNIQQEEVPPNYGAGATPPDPTTWGNIDVGGYRYYNADGYWFTPGIVNGLRLDRIDLAPGKSMIFAYDREAFLRRHTPPAGVEVREFRNCDGWYPGVPDNVAIRGGATRWHLRSEHDALGIRSGDSRWVDYVAWGPWTPPAEFWVTNGDNPIYNQNASGMPADRVWGNRAAANSIYLNGPGETVSPVHGIQRGGSIRRIGAMGGGNWESDPANPIGSGTEFARHDSGTKNDWETLVYPKWGNEGPLEAFEAYDIDLGEHAQATVLYDNSDIGDMNGTITVGPGEAREYDHLSVHERIFCSGGLVEFTYERVDYDTFYGVRKTKGAGISCEGSTLDVWYNSNPDVNGVPFLELGRPYRVSAIEINTWYEPPRATVVADTRHIDGTVRVQPGDAVRFPPSGSITMAPLDENTIRTPYVLNYTSHDDSAFYGVSNPGPAAFRLMLPGTVVNDNKPAPRLRQYSVIVSRRNYEPVQDPDTFLGTNQDWQVVVATGNTGHNDKGYTGTVVLDGASQRLRKIHLRIEGMWGDGPAYLSEVKVHRKPLRIVDSAITAAKAAKAPYSYARMCEDVLIAARIPEWQRDIPIMGLPIRGERISQGNVWDTLVQLCTKAGYIITDGPDDIIRIRPDPRVRAKALPTGVPSLELNQDTIAEFTVTPRPRLEVAQVEGTGVNSDRDERWTMRYPETKGSFGDVRPLGDFPAESAHATLIRLQLAYLTLNGGFDFSCSIGHQSDIQLGDILPLNNVIDQAGRLYAGQHVILTDIDAQMDHEGVETTLQGRDYRSV